MVLVLAGATASTYTAVDMPDTPLPPPLRKTSKRAADTLKSIAKPTPRRLYVLSGSLVDCCGRAGEDDYEYLV